MKDFSKRKIEIKQETRFRRPMFHLQSRIHQIFRKKNLNRNLALFIKFLFYLCAGGGGTPGIVC